MKRDIDGNIDQKITKLMNTIPNDWRSSYGSLSSRKAPYKLLSLGYLIPSWGLLFWLNFSTEPSLFGHFIAIPSLFMMTGYCAYLIARKGE
ncbi:hypothetical protein [Shewanella pealeana]|uniref:hypothetical protein n=1 Tax=Shewanella pealeana TaxID=70864 RepID=UPI0000E9B0C3|nr:hypothetical protein [Shewanella pealeana]